MTGNLRHPGRFAAAVGVATAVLVLGACSSGSTSSNTSNAAPTNGSLTVGLLGDIGQPPDPDIYYANNGTAPDHQHLRGTRAVQEQRRPRRNRAAVGHVLDGE